MTRVQTLLIRMLEYPNDPHILKSCCGALSLLARNDDHKMEIAQDGLKMLRQSALKFMHHVELLESICDLFWNISFNHTKVKELVAKFEGVQLIITAIHTHGTSVQLIKSALGALSNICQLKESQRQFGRGNGITVLLHIARQHTNDLHLIPMACDALSSAMVGNAENIMLTQKAGGIEFMILLLNQGRTSPELLKSACHSLAILSDVPGNGRIMGDGNAVPSVIRSLKQNSNFRGLEKIAIVVLLRILNESPTVSSQMLQGGLLVVLNTILEKVCLTDEETTAAICHIMYEISEHANLHKLELSSYCTRISQQGILSTLGKYHSSNKTLVRTIFRFLGNCAQNGNPPKAFVNMEILETLLELLITTSKVTDVTECVVMHLTALSPTSFRPLRRTTMNSTLPALLICYHSASDKDLVVMKIFALLVLDLIVPSEMGEGGICTALRGFVGGAVRWLSHTKNNPSSLDNNNQKGTDLKKIVVSFLSSMIETGWGKEAVLQSAGPSMQDRLRDGATLYEKELYAKLNPKSVVEEESESDGEPDACVIIDTPQANQVEIERRVERERIESRRMKSAIVETGLDALYSSVDAQGRHFPKNTNFPKLNVAPTDSEKCQMTPASAGYIYELQSRQRRTLMNPRAGVQVYQSRTAGGGATSSRVAVPVPYECPESSSSDADFDGSPSLSFDSDFESGNLYRAIRVGPYEYDLILRADLHTSGYMQWFNFAFSNVITRSIAYRFNIINLCKPDSLFNQGLQPVLYSMRHAAEKKRGWIRVGDNVCYYPNPFRRPDGENLNSMYYSLSFSCTFPEAQMDDTYFLAHSYPYTVSDHRRHISSILKRPRVSNKLRRRVLCRSLAGHECDLLTITNFAALERMPTKKRVVLSARVHPGEAQASWIMRGVIDFLISETPGAAYLRELYVFQVVPMLNPDGVYFGHNRCGLSACDLNRQWKRPNRALHPTIHATKSLIRNEKLQNDVYLYVDIHGHSRKKNVFMYGCDSKKKPNPSSRLFPKMLSDSKSARPFFSYSDCSFTINKGRESTARVVVARELGIMNSFTLEASFCGPNFGIYRDTHFTTTQLQTMGSALVLSIWEFSIPSTTRRNALVLQYEHGVPIHESSIWRDYTGKNVSSSSNTETTITRIPKIGKKKKSEETSLRRINSWKGTSRKQSTNSRSPRSKSCSELKEGFLPPTVTPELYGQLKRSSRLHTASRGTQRGSLILPLKARSDRWSEKLETLSIQKASRAMTAAGSSTRSALRYQQRYV